MLNVFHISDLHYTGQPSGQVRDEATAGAQAILRLARELKSLGVLTGEVCVCITGDLVQTGAIQPDNIKCDFAAVQSEFLEPLIGVLGIPAERIFIVPGNHELDRNSVPENRRINVNSIKDKRTCEDDIQRDLREKLSSYFQFIESHGYSSVTSSSPRVSVFTVNGQPIVCLNGLVGSYSRREYDDKGHLFILNSEFGTVFNAIPEFSVVLLHHPLSWFEDQCASDLKEFLAARRCRLLTGHIHDQGVDWVETGKGTLAIVQAGAGADAGTNNQVAVAWYPPSNSAAVRHFSFDKRLGNYPLTAATETCVVPSSARSFFERSEAFFDPRLFANSRAQAFKKYQNELTAAFGRDPLKYIPPDLMIYAEDQFSAKRIRVEEFHHDSGYRVMSGEELSGKTAFVFYAAALENSSKDNRELSVVIDFRALSAGKDIGGLVQKVLVSFGLASHQADYVISVGLVSIWIDNFDPENSASVAKFDEFFRAFPKLRWSVAVRGGQRFMPSRAPSTFPKDNISYYELSEITAPTVIKMIAAHSEGATIERPRAVVERVFRSINNLRAPRTIFYVDNLVDMFLSDGSVEPLNRYLLIENLLSEKIREAHKSNLPGQAIDMDMLETFIAQIAHHLLKNEQPYLSKADYYALADSFIERKGLQRKRFNPDSILAVLTGSFVLREYDGGFGFMMLSVEDYYLAKHMGRDEEFRSLVMSADGLQNLPSVAEYYIAQSPSDKQRVSEVMAILDDFEEEVWPLLQSVKDEAESAISGAAPGNGSSGQDEILTLLGEIDGRDEDNLGTVLISAKPELRGETKRLKYSAEERGATFLQLGASILGVTRTLDQVDRIEIFKKLRNKILICFYGMPFLAKHLADGGEIKFRGITVRADYVGALAVSEDRFYIILRGMLYNAMKQFGTWAGSPSFFNAAVSLRDGEEDELIRAALFSQNVEADLSEATRFIPEISGTLNSAILKEVVIRLYVDALTLVPLERSEENKAVDLLVDATIDINPPPGAKNASMLNVRKTQLRQELVNTIGINSYLGRLVKPKKKPVPKAD